MWKHCWLAALLVAQIGLADTLRTERLTYSEAAVLFADRVVKGSRAQVKSTGGKIATGSLAGFSNGDVLLKGTTRIPLCSIASVRLSRNTSRPITRVLKVAGGAALGFVAGTVIGAPMALGGAETAGVATFIAMPVIGGVMGAKAGREYDHTIYMLQPQTPDSPCVASEEGGSDKGSK